MGKRVPFLLGFILVVFAVLLQILDISVVRHWIPRLENLTYDMQLRTQLLTKQHVPFKTDIAIVDIDDRSLEVEGRWPWPRSKLAGLTDQLRQAGAVVIAFDMLFPQIEANIASSVLAEIAHENLLTAQDKITFQKILPYFKTDTKFADSLGQGDDVVGISFLPEVAVEGVVPAPLLTLLPSEYDLGFIEAVGMIGVNPLLATKAKNMGFINAFADEDGVIRRSPLLVRYKNGLYPSLALEAVRIFLLSNVKLVTASYGKSLRLEGIQIGNSTIQTDEEAQVIIPFRGPSFTFPYYSVTDILNNKIPKNVFSGKIVFVGSTATGLGDIKGTAVEKVFPGIEINATIADGLIKNNFSIKPSWAQGAEVFITALVGVILLFIFPYLGPLMLTVWIIFIPIGLIAANNWLAADVGIILSLFFPVILTIILAVMNMIYGYFFETRQRSRLKDIFGQYVPAKHIEAMLKSSGNYALYGEDREMSVLFADIRNFTTIAEPLSASQLKDLLNQFFTPMTEIIFNYHGTIDKYIGDLIMAFWGAPLKTPLHAEQALDAALDMQTKVIQLRPILAQQNWPEINIGIGINSGVMSVGDMGSKFRRNYTVLGDVVNLGSRVESLTKYYGVKILTTEYTVQGQNKFIFRLLDRVRVKGKKMGVVIYEVICRKTEMSADLQKELEMHTIGLEYYFKQDWKKAREIFSELNQNYPHTRIYIIYLERLNLFDQSPPASDWDGIFTHTDK